MATNPTGGTTAPLLERVKNILMQPRAEWARIDAEPTTIGDIYRSYVIILAAIPAVATIIGGLLVGGNFGYFSVRLPIGWVIGHALVGYILALVGCYVMALIIEALAPTFGGTKDRVKAFKVAAYSYTAGWVAGILLILPALAIIVGLLSLYSLYLMYVGLPILMKTPADRAVPYIVAVIVAAIVLYLIIGAVTGAIMSAFMPMPGVGSITVNVPG
jgi:uncharacterized membrane protein